jgi:hypothetical protein
MSITLQPVPVETDSADKDGLLVFNDGCLVGVLVRLEDPVHQQTLLGSWYLECATGKLREACNPVFENLQSALAWMERRLVPVISCALLSPYLSPLLYNSLAFATDQSGL